MSAIEIIEGGDCKYARGHHSDEVFLDACLSEGIIVMDQPWRGYWRWGFGASEDPSGLGAWSYSQPGRGRFPVTVTEWCISTVRDYPPLPTLGAHNYELVLDEVKRLVALDPEPDSLNGRRLAALGALLEQYEAHHFPIGVQP